MNAAAIQGNQGENAQNAAEVNPAVPFLQWCQGVQLAEYKELYYGDPAVVGTPDGRRYLRSAFCYAIRKFEAGRTWRGKFSAQNFLSKNGLFEMNIPPVASLAGSGFSDLLLDLVALCNGLIEHYRLGGVAAMYTDHLHFFVMNPRAAVIPAGSTVLQTRFIAVVQYHFSFASPAALKNLFSSLHKARQYLSHLDVQALDLLIEDAWIILGMDNCPVGTNWCNELMFNPIFWEIMHSTRKGKRVLAYQNNSLSLFRFGRNDEVHGPEQTLGFLPAIPVRPTPPPPNIRNWQYVYDPVHGTWQWVTIPPRGQWNWPAIPTHPNWQRMWNIATQGSAPAFPTLAPVPLFGQTYDQQVRQQMDSPDQPGLMLGKAVGIFFAHASALILVEFQLNSKYIDGPFDLYRDAMDSYTRIPDSYTRIPDPLP